MKQGEVNHAMQPFYKTSSELDWTQEKKETTAPYVYKIKQWQIDRKRNIVEFIDCLNDGGDEGYDEAGRINPFSNPNLSRVGRLAYLTFSWKDTGSSRFNGFFAIGSGLNAL